MKTLQLKRQLTQFGLNPSEWGIKIKNSKTILFINNNLTDFILVARMKNGNKLDQLQVYSL